MFCTCTRGTRAQATKDTRTSCGLEGAGGALFLYNTDWTSVGNALGDAGSWVGNNLNNLFQGIPVFDVYDVPENHFSYEHIKIAQDQNYPKVLTYDDNKDNARERHKIVDVLPSSNLFDRDMYPFKTTYESGIINPATGQPAFVMYVPSSDNRSLGGKLGVFIKEHNITNGKKFRVNLVNSDNKKIPVPVLSPSSQSSDEKKPNINLKPVAVGVGAGGILGLLMKIAEFLRLVAE